MVLVDILAIETQTEFDCRGVKTVLKTTESFHGKLVLNFCRMSITLLLDGSKIILSLIFFIYFSVRTHLQRNDFLQGRLISVTVGHIREWFSSLPNSIFRFHLYNAI